MIGDRKTYEVIKDTMLALFILFIVLLILLVLVFNWSHHRLDNQKTYDYIMTYGDNVKYYISFTADVSDTGSGYVVYTLDDGSVISIVDGKAVWNHKNGCIEYYNDCRVTSH